MIPIYQPYIENYKCSAIKAIESGWISNHGEYVEKATQKLKEILKVPYVILMSNGTVATHCLFKSLKFKHPEISKIYVPNNVYVAAWNSALMEYPIEYLEVLPIDEHTWNMKEDEELILSLEKNSALLVVHNLGNIINVPKIKRLRPDIIIVEDNCEGVFGYYEGVKSGCSNSSLCSSISFYGNKTITTGEGGAFITTDKIVYNYIKKIYSQGMSNERYIHDVHAYNYRMTNIQSAFLYDQLNIQQFQLFL
jgi:perosamine synthetase